MAKKFVKVTHEFVDGDALPTDLSFKMDNTLFPAFQAICTEVSKKSGKLIIYYIVDDLLNTLHAGVVGGPDMGIIQGSR